MLELTAANVTATMMDCLFKGDEVQPGVIPEGTILIEGIVSKYGFDPEGIKRNAGKIGELLDQLPDVFKEGGGGGMSFLQACCRSDGRQWTGLHRDMEALFVLGEAAGRVVCLMPREMWGALPGGMPYYLVKAQPGAANGGAAEAGR